MLLALRWWWSNRWRRYLTSAVLALMLTMVLSVELTSQSWFCNSCHIMNSYYASWQTGSHKNIECVQCHIPPGVGNYAWAKLNGLGQVVDDVLERSGTKPSADVSDLACTRSGCHDLETVRKSKTTHTKYLFNHEKHLGRSHNGIEIRCTTCHSHYQGAKHFEVNANVCVTCHLIGPEPKPAGKVVLVAGYGEPSPGEAVVLSASGPPQTTQTTNAVPAQPSDPAAPHRHIATSPDRHILASAPADAKAAPVLPPRQCKTCHTPPDKPIEYRGLKVVHAEYLAYGAACESCHRGVTTAPQPIRDDKCFACHDFGIERIGKVEELHHQHAAGKGKVECFSCHGLTYHGPSAQSMRLDQIDCQACHRDQHQIQRTTYQSGLLAAAGPATAPTALPTTAPTTVPTTAHTQPDGPAVTPMFLAHVDCTGCHIQPQKLTGKPASAATVAKATPKACDVCHKPGLGDQMVPLWQKNTRQLYDQVAQLLPPADQPPASPQALALVNEARQLLDLVRLDGSWGVHSPVYTQKLLEQAREKLVQAQATTPPRDHRAP